MQREVFYTSMDDAHNAAMNVRKHVEGMGMIFLWSYLAEVNEDAVTLEDEFYEEVTIH